MAKQLTINVPLPLPDGRDLVQGPLTYNTDGLATRHNAEFRNHPRFAKAYAAGLKTIESRSPGLDIAWRVHVACWAADHATKLEGDFVEFGVFTGILSRSIVEYVDFGKQTNRRLWLFDTFQGLDESKMSETELKRGLVTSYNKSYTGDYYGEVQQTFAPFPNVKIIKGSVPDSLAGIDIPKAAYVSIDMNSAAPEIAAATYIWPRLVSGGIIIYDDYAWMAHIEQKRAHDQWAAERGCTILTLPTGQGLLIKP